MKSHPNSTVIVDYNQSSVWETSYILYIYISVFDPSAKCAFSHRSCSCSGRQYLTNSSRSEKPRGTSRGCFGLGSSTWVVLALTQHNIRYFCWDCNNSWIVGLQHVQGTIFCCANIQTSGAQTFKHRIGGGRVLSKTLQENDFRPPQLLQFQSRVHSNIHTSCSFFEVWLNGCILNSPSDILHVSRKPRDKLTKCTWIVPHSHGWSLPVAFI